MTALTDFLTGEGVDGQGLTIDEVLSKPNAWLEHNHQHIQWLFPNRRPSRYNPSAPTLSGSEIDYLKRSHAAQIYIKRSLARMTRFFNETDDWLSEKNHNHLRVTRIIEATALLIDITHARDFLEHMARLNTEAGSPLGAASLRHWRKRLEEITTEIAGRS